MKNLGVFLILCCFGWNAFSTQTFKDCTQLKEKCFELENHPEQAFVLHAPTQKVAILVHGITDSAYTFKDVGLALNEQGYNVYVPLLSGHGTVDEDLNNVSISDWLRDVRETYSLASQENHTKKVVFVGFSLGGVLATTFAEYNPNRVQALVLFAPAYKVQSTLGRFVCTYHIPYKEFVRDTSDETPSTKTNYQKFSRNGFCELTGLGAVIRSQTSMVTAPVFAVFTAADQNIDVDDAIGRVRDMNSPVKKIEYFTTEPRFDLNLESTIDVLQILGKPLVHSDLIYKEDSLYHKRQNPRFDYMMDNIKKFLEEATK